jgi:hypothetical protein
MSCVSCIQRVCVCCVTIYRVPTVGMYQKKDASHFPFVTFVLGLAGFVHYFSFVTNITELFNPNPPPPLFLQWTTQPSPVGLLVEVECCFHVIIYTNLGYVVLISYYEYSGDVDYKFRFQTCYFLPN